MNAATITRRLFLRQSAVASAVAATIAAPAVAEAIVTETAEDRARHHWRLFCEAMEEMTAGSNGFLVMGGRRDAVGGSPGGAWFNAKAIVYEADPRNLARGVPFTVERHREVVL